VALKPAHSYQDASMQPPEPAAWQEAEAEAASDDLGTDEQLVPPEAFGGEALADFWNAPTPASPGCPICGHTDTLSVIQRVTRRIPVVVELVDGKVVEVTRDRGAATILADWQDDADEEPRDVCFVCDPEHDGCGARFDTLAGLTPVEPPAEERAA
jgi:hypothetical protein